MILEPRVEAEQQAEAVAADPETWVTVTGVV